jgi:F-type H+-transporting ATPase subunit delta
VFRDLVAERWSGPDDLRAAVEVLAAEAALHAAGATARSTTSRTSCSASPGCSSASRCCGRRSPTGPAGRRKSALVRELLGSRARPTTTRLVEIAVTRPRGGSLESALEELSRLAAGRRSRYVARVRVARPLDPAQEIRLAASLGRIYGREVQLQVDVDPSVIGGVEVRVGDEVLDGTVSHNLEQVRRRLAG